MNISDVNLGNTNQSAMPRSAEGKDGIRYDSDFARIEELIKQNTFSREEITHLMEILNSRVDNEWEKQKSSNAGGDTHLVSWTAEILRTPSEGKQQDFDRTMIGAFRENSNVPVGVGASPIDIARAYMAGRTAEGGQDRHDFMSNSERAQPNNEFARKPPLLPPASSKPSICWPGAMVHDRLGFTTPQSQRGRHRLHEFPRTPYSRTILSKSTSKLQADSGHADTSTPFQQSQTSIYGQVNSMGKTVDGYGSVGPIRRIRNRFASEVRPKRSIFLSSSKEIPSKTATPQVFGGFLPSAEKKLEPGETSGVSKYWSGDNILSSSDKGVSSPNVSSSQAVRRILEHLDRSQPTPKEKEAELKLATAWRSSPEAANVSNSENFKSGQVEELASQKNTEMSRPNFPGVFNKSSSRSNFLESINDKGKDDAVNGNAKASSSIFTATKSTPDANPMLLFGLKGTFDPPVKNVNENAFAAPNHGQTDTNSQFSRPHLSNGQDGKMVAGTAGSEFSKNHGIKPSLPSISINKPNLRAVSSENGPGFTFPVSASSGINSEPPTPSIMPSSSASIPSHPIDVPNIPSYTFGPKKSAPSLVFSFPSTSSASTHDASDLKFSFGSEKKTRLSFSFFGKDAICY